MSKTRKRRRRHRGGIAPGATDRSAAASLPSAHWVAWDSIDSQRYDREEVPVHAKGWWIVKLPRDSKEYFVPAADASELPDGAMVTRPDGTWYVVGASLADVFSD